MPHTWGEKNAPKTLLRHTTFPVCADRSGAQATITSLPSSVSTGQTRFSITAEIGYDITPDTFRIITPRKSNSLALTSTIRPVNRAYICITCIARDTSTARPYFAVGALTMTDLVSIGIRQDFTVAQVAQSCI